MIDRRTLLKGLAAVAAAPVLAGCDGDMPGVIGGDEVDDATERLLSHRIRTPRSIDPFDADEAGYTVDFQLFDCLTRYDFAAGELVPWAASSYTVSEDAQTFTFALAESGVFSNGDPVVAADFKRAWERLVNPKTAAGWQPEDSMERPLPSPAAFHLSLVEGYNELSAGSADGLSGVTCPDDYTLQVHLTKPYADFAYVVAHPALAPVPAAALDDPAGFHVQPIGNGPFALGAAWDGSTNVVLERAPEYAGNSGAVQLEGICFVLEDDTSAAYRTFETGDLDVCDVPVDQMDAAEREYGLVEDAYELTEGEHLLNAMTSTVGYLVLNTAKEPFDDADVRRAISLAIDREKLCDKVLQGACRPAESIVAPCIPLDGENAWPYATYDADRARALLETLYPADADGNRELEISLAYSDSGSNAKVMEAIKEDLAAVGVSVATEVSDWDDLIGRYRVGDFQCGRMSWTPDYPVLDNVLHPLFRSGVFTGGNYARYANTEVDAALDAARATVDEAARRQLLTQAFQQIGEDCPVIPLAVGTMSVATSERVTALALDPQRRPHLASASLE